MKRHFTLSMLLVMFTTAVMAQQPSPLNRSNRELIFAGYLIRVIPLNGNGYGYDIFYKDRIVIHQLSNPFTLAPTGMREEQDVYKIAKWQILQFRQKPNIPVMKTQLVSKDVARQLNIKLNSSNY